MTRDADPGASPGRLWLWGPAVAYAALLLVGSAMPQPPPVAEDVSDRTLHTLGYAGLAWLLLRALSGATRAGVTVRRAVLAACGAFGYGVVVEVVQLFIPARFFEVADLVANAVGAGLGVTIVYVVTRVLGPGRRPFRRSSHDDIPSADQP